MGNWLRDLDSPTEAQRKWRRVLPPVWSYQIVFWLIGFVMIWALVFKAGLSRASAPQIERANTELL